jgi:hypothetical protein
MQEKTMGAEGFSYVLIFPPSCHRAFKHFQQYPNLTWEAQNYYIFFWRYCQTERHINYEYYYNNNFNDNSWKKKRTGKK